MGPNCFLPPRTLLERKYAKYWLSDKYTICHDGPQTNLDGVDGEDDYSPNFERKKKRKHSFTISHAEIPGIFRNA